jgi:YcxB-like protein
MNIKTKEFNISETELRHVTRIVYYKALKVVIIVFAIITLISVIHAIFNPEVISTAVGCVVALSYFLALPFMRNSAKVQPKLNFKSRICEITDSYFIITFEDGSLSKVHFNNYIKIIRESDWYFLYLTKAYFEYLPIRAFNSEADINEFETLMKNKKLME